MELAKEEPRKEVLNAMSRDSDYLKDLMAKLKTVGEE